jgi:Cu+-exporting ATPase
MNKILSISGMHCTSCAVNLESAFNKEPGIKKAVVNYASEKAFIEFDPKIITQEKILEIVSDLGYRGGVGKDKGDGGSEETETRKLLIRFWVLLVISLPLFFVAMMMESTLTNRLIQLLLGSVTVIAAKDIWISGFKALTRLVPTMDSLIFIGTAVAYFASLYYFNQSNQELYFETVSFVLMFITLGKYLEAKSKGRAGEAIKKLMGLQPKTALIIKNGKEKEVAISELVIGNLVIVKPGEKIATDGEVVKGESSVNEAMITGESMPVSKKIGDKVIGGTINESGTLTIKVTKIGSETMLSQIIKLVEEAQGSKAPIQKLADQVSAYFVPVIILIAIATFIFWLNFSGLNFALLSAIAVLVIALGLATPTAIMVGTGMGAEKGILVKDAASLEILHKVKAIVFDKTGTLTEGKPRVTDIVQSEKLKVKSDLLRLAASAEMRSEHSLARAIVERAKEEGLKLEEPEKFEAISGSGIIVKLSGLPADATHQALQAGCELRIGNANFIGKATAEMDKKAQGLEKEGKTVVWVEIDKQIAGIIAIADTVKSDAKEAIEKLKHMGIESYLLTGDNRETAFSIASQVGISKENVLSQVMPQEKEGKIKELKKQGKIVAMVGDGVNDAPALASADIGIAMGAGTDVAIESAGIVLTGSDPVSVVSAIKLSKETLKIIKQNLFWAFFYNIILVPVAAGVFSPFGFQLNPIMASLAMAFSSVSVVVNSLRLKTIKI